MIQFQGFKPEALQRIAGTLGYQGDMNGFEQYLMDNPDKKQTMDMYNNKAMQMAMGGSVQKFVTGGLPDPTKTLPEPTPQVENGQPLGSSIAVNANTRPVSYNYTYEQAVTRQAQRDVKSPEEAAAIQAALQAGNSAQSTTAADPRAIPQQYIPQTNFTPEMNLQDVMVSQAKTPGLPTGSTVVPMGTQMTSQQFVSPTSGQVAGSTAVPTALATTSQAQQQQATTAGQIAPAIATPQVSQVAAETQAAQGTISQEQQVQAQQGQLSTGATPTAPQFDPNFVAQVTSGDLNVTADQLVEAKGQDEVAPAAKIAESSGIDPAIAQQATVSINELPQAAQIQESNMAQAQAAQSSGFLREEAVAYAAKLNSFDVDNNTLAQAIQGEVGPLGTVQGQLEKLMKQFDDGTPVWAAGALRAANAAMASRGLGGSSMAGSAILQAAMESALPIAAQDAQTFNEMNMSNLNRRQQVSLSNAAAQQGLALQNLSNAQQAALQNSTNAFSLQTQDLSNMQQTFLSNAQIKAALQGQNLSNQQQVNLVTAGRYAEVANMNLNNRQQTALVNNANSLQVDLSNLSNKQQSYLANAQLAASLQGKQLDIQQQAAIQNAARFSEAANITFTANQQEQLHNSELMKTIGLSNLTASQAITLQNAAQIAGMDMQNLNNRQQAAVQQAQNFLNVNMANLSNQQQTEMFTAQQRIQSLFTDQAAINAAQQFNATSQNQTDQFFASLSSNTSQFNATQANAQAQFNAGQVNVLERFNAEINNQREQFNAQNRLIIDQANAQWRREIATADTAAVNRANEINASSLLGTSQSAYNNLWQYYADNMEWAWTSAENERKRINDLAQVQLQADSQFDAQKYKSDAESSAGFGSLIGSLFTSDLSKTLAGSILGGIF